MNMQDSYLTSKPHYEILDGLRGVAAAMVVAFHLLEAHSGGNHLNQIINHGYLAVDFFFMLSGFVIGYAYDDRWNKMSTGTFFKRRLIRLQPMVVMGSIVGAALFWFQEAPCYPAMEGVSAGAVLLVMLLGMAGVLSADSETYKILNTIGDAAFYFLPVMVAASASKKFNTNMFIAIAIAGLMLHPDFRTMMEAVTVGDTAAHFLGIPVVGVKYTYTVIPALCMTWILSYIERAIDKITPAVTKNFLKPMLIFLIAAPIAIIVVGPAGIMIGEGISAFVYFVQAKLGFLAVGIMGALWPLLVITGMHRVFTPTILQTISETGMEGTVMPSEIGANLSLGGVSLAVAFKTKNSELRQTALAAASSALIAGTTEPALYGVAVRLKRPLIASLITGFVCGCLAGMAGLASRSMVSPSVLTGVQFIDPANPGVSIAWIAGISVLSIVLSFVLTLVIGFEDLPEEE